MIAILFLVLFSIQSFAGTIKGTVIAKSIRSPKDVIIYVNPALSTVENSSEARKGGVKDIESPPSTEHAVIDQKGLTFIPHVLPILKSTTVDFLNSDTVAHNVFSPSEIADRFNLGTWQRGVVRSYTFNKLGVVEVLCNLHPDMSAYILVLSNHYFTKTEKDGRFIIEDIPNGSYTLSVWHERIKTQSKEIMVDGEVDVNFEL